MPQTKQIPIKPLDLAKQAIAEHPEAFDALMEFEKTKKLPRFTRKKRVNFTIDSDIFTQFRRNCEQNSMKMSTKLEQLMLDQIRVR